MHDVVEKLLKDGRRAARKYRRLERRQLQLINDIMRLVPGDPRQPELEREKRLLRREMAELSGPLYIETATARRDGAQSQEGK